MAVPVIQDRTGLWVSSSAHSMAWCSGWKPTLARLAARIWPPTHSMATVPMIPMPRKSAGAEVTIARPSERMAPVRPCPARCAPASSSLMRAATRP